MNAVSFIKEKNRQPKIPLPFWRLPSLTGGIPYGKVWVTKLPGRRVAGIHRYSYREMTAASMPPRLTESVLIRG